MKILKHAKENINKLATGKLQGVFWEDNLEITFSYPEIHKEDNEEVINLYKK